MNPRLTLSTVTSGSQVILPAYPATALTVGLIFIFQDPRRTDTGTFAAASDIMSLPHWGLVFCAIAVLETFAFLISSKRAFQFGLIIGCGLCTFWAILLWWSALHSTTTSFTGCVWVAFVALAHIASIRSLARDVVFHAPPT